METEAPTQVAPTLHESEQVAREEAERLLAEAAKGQDAAKEAIDTPRKEAQVLGFLLGPPKPLVFGLPVEYDTDEGRVTLRFVIQQLRGEKFREIEKHNSKDGSLGPLAEIDQTRVSAETAWEAILAIQVPATGEEIRLNDQKFLDNGAGHPMPGVDAILSRFGYQFGIIEGVVGEVRRISGWDGERIGTASRMVVEAVSNS